MPPKKARRSQASAYNSNGDIPKFVTELGPHDVLMGRGAMSTDYEGNQRLRAIVASRHEEYAAATRRGDKHRIAEEIVQTVMDRGGRFLEGADKVDEARQLNIPRNKVVWLVVPDSNRKLLINKVKQLMRDVGIRRNETGQTYTAPPVYSQISASTAQSSTKPGPMQGIVSARESESEVNAAATAIQGLSSLFHQSRTTATLPPMNPSSMPQMQGPARMPGPMPGPVASKPPEGGGGVHHGPSNHRPASQDIKGPTFAIPNMISFPANGAPTNGGGPPATTSAPSQTAAASSAPSAARAWPPTPAGMESILQALMQHQRPPADNAARRAIYSQVSSTTTRTEASHRQAVPLPSQQSHSESTTFELARRLLNELEESEHRRHREMSALIAPLFGSNNNNSSSADSNDFPGMLLNYLQRRDENGGTHPRLQSRLGLGQAEAPAPPPSTARSSHMSPLEAAAAAFLLGGDDSRSGSSDGPGSLPALLASIMGSSGAPAPGVAPAPSAPDRSRDLHDIFARLTQQQQQDGRPPNQPAPQRVAEPPPPQDRPPPDERERLMQILQMLQDRPSDQTRG